MRNSHVQAPWNQNVTETESIPQELNFEITVEPSYHLKDGTFQEVEGLNVIKANGIVEGHTGNRYTPYQNEEFWDVATSYIKQTGGELASYGNYKGASFIIARHEDYEIVKGDTIERYDAFLNPFNGKVSVSVGQSDMRIVCGNMLAGIMRQDGSYRIKHYNTVSGRVSEAVKAAYMMVKARQDQREYLQKLASIPLNGNQIGYLVDELFGANDVEDISTRKTNNITTMHDLIESGLGTDIKGVRGTAYGYIQAAVEYADHKMTQRENSDKLKNSFDGSIMAFKKKANAQMLQLIQ